MFCRDDHSFTKWDEPVPCVPLKTYLDNARNRSIANNDKKFGKTIDFMSIDVEKYDVAALHTIPFDEYNIRVIVIECYKMTYCELFLKSKGYNVLSGHIKNSKKDIIAWKNDCV